MERLSVDRQRGHYLADLSGKGLNLWNSSETFTIKIKVEWRQV